MKTTFKDFLNENVLSDFEIKTSSDDIYEVAEANGLTIKITKEIIPIHNITGGVNLNEPSERRRIDSLKEKILSNRYISRIIVDSNNDIIEGQHRFTAMKELKFDAVPVVKLFGVDDFIKDRKKISEIIDKHHLGYDYKNQLIEMIAKVIANENGIVEELKYYDAPKGFEAVWKDVVDYIISNQ